MRPLSASELLKTWEYGVSETPLARALALVATFCPELTEQEVASLTIGERDGYLLTFREWIFGSQMACQTVCPACKEQLEMKINTSDIRAPSQTAAKGPLTRNIDGYDLTFRLPTSHDLAQITGTTDTDIARQKLLDFCILDVTHNSCTCTKAELPVSVIKALVEEMDRADPQADPHLALSCPSCNHGWTAPFDILSFIWSEINSWAQRLLREVHTLASAYGWQETEILNMSPMRRNCYLGMISQ